MFSSIRMVITMLLITGIAGAGFYVMKLRADNATLKANQIELERGIEEQNKVLEQQKADFEAIMESNKNIPNLWVWPIEESLAYLYETQLVKNTEEM